MVKKMREIHNYLSSSTRLLPGVGDKMYEALLRLGCDTLGNLLFHFPSKITLRDIATDFRKIRNNVEYIVRLKFVSVENLGRSKVRKVVCLKDGNIVELLYFSYFPHYLFARKQEGDDIVICGTAKIHPKNGVQFMHPQIYDNESEIDRVSVIYPLTYAVNSAVIHKIVKIVLKEVKYFDIPEWIDEERVSEYGWKNFINSLDHIHNPKYYNDVGPSCIYRRRLAFDELLASQLAVSIARKGRTKNMGNPCIFDGSLKGKLLSKIGFTLTNGQVSALGEIEIDQKSDNRMVRLVQGDVGSGKTLVALCAIANILEGGHQSAFMAPTDILANQHYEWVSKVAEDFDINVALLTGKITGKKRAGILSRLENGDIDILIGTHAIFQSSVIFKDLKLVIIDEQHRFGVKQRMALMEKGDNCDVLVMSATPIPRTLSLTMYGDMDISVISDKPEGRLPIATYSLQNAKVQTIISLMQKKLDSKEKVYWICPLIDGDPEGENAAVENRFDYLKKKFGTRAGIMHGKLNQDLKEQVMNGFSFGDVDVLVSTTVVEVGVNVPEATLLIIESPDKFGLAQLHQLRGRVGRGTKQSECILLYLPENLTESSVKKIKIMKDSNDGFYIAEQDLQLRGGGSILGNKQSGIPDFRIADLDFHKDLLLKSNKEAKVMLQNSENPDVRSRIELLLNMFGYSKNFFFLNAG